MKEDIKISGEKFFLFYYVIFMVGIAGHFSDRFIGIMLSMTPYLLLFMGLSVLFFSGAMKSGKFIIWFICIYMLTLLLEIIGVSTGKIFGDYYYGNVLGFKIYDVPLIIGFNWLFVILGGISISKLLKLNSFFTALITAVICVIFDFLLEPVAVKFDYWQWKDMIIPVQNYIAWFLISFFSALIYCLNKIEIPSKMFIHYFAAQLIFFLTLNFK